MERQDKSDIRIIGRCLFMRTVVMKRNVLDMTNYDLNQAPVHHFIQHHQTVLVCGLFECDVL
jgi:hypothetical protein